MSIPVIASIYLIANGLVTLNPVIRNPALLLAGTTAAAALIATAAYKYKKPEDTERDSTSILCFPEESNSERSAHNNRQITFHLFPARLLTQSSKNLLILTSRKTKGGRPLQPPTF